MVVKLSDDDGQHKESDLPAGHLTQDRSHFSNAMNYSTHGSTMEHFDATEACTLIKGEPSQLLQAPFVPTAAETRKTFDQTCWDLPNYASFQSTVPQMVHDEDFFGGICYRNKIQSFSKYYQVSELGSIQRRVETPHPVEIFMHDPGEEADKSFETIAGEISKSAGKIFLQTTVLLDNQSQPKRVCASGFWLGRDKFVTCRHFYWNHYEKYYKDQNKRIEAEEDLKKAKPLEHLIYVTCNTAAEDYRPNGCKVRLLAVDNDADIAIFQSINDNYKPLSWLEISHLDAVSPDNKAKTAWAWTVGYAMANGYQEKPETREKNAFCWDLCEENPTLTAFDFQLAQFYHALETDSRVNSTTSANIERTPKPKFEDIFRPNLKALAMGEANRPEYHPGVRLEKAVNASHTMSGFYGCSGAMVLTFRNDRKDDPVVIGIFHSGIHNSIYNSYQAFTEQGLAWIKTQVEGRDG